ncbi:rho guanine nucleotide exchange factor 18-like [Paramisgurnus dabryanus]|uniref:rho guanine nucleotide exchange factor 18-like n=1 Tax=Paramisgurnus dabryanus TaxID=90735 RepID=UPI0031F43246
MDEMQLERLFPQVDSLLEMAQLLNSLKQRGFDSMEEGSSQSYCIHRIGDIFIAQFSGELRDKLQYCYGVFCSHHTDAVHWYRYLLLNSKKFQSFIRKICRLSIIRRLGIPEIILLITHCITNYQVLVERVITYSQADSEKHRELVQGLELLKDTIAKVNIPVDEFENAARLRDLSNKLEPKSQVKMAHGRVFRREDMLQGDRRLLYEGMLNWRSTSNKSKDVLVLLLSDVLLLLLEKDQRLTFASLDNQPPVIPLQKLTVHEVAHDEKALFLFTASSDPPEMYEFYTSSGEVRRAWRDQIWKAVVCCPEEEEEEPEELSERIRNFASNLCMRDAFIQHHLTENHRLFASIAAYVTGADDCSPSEHNAVESLQGDQILTGALKDVEHLQRLLVACELDQTPSTGEGMDLVPVSKSPRIFTGFDNDDYTLPRNVTGSLLERMKDGNQRANSDSQIRELCTEESLELSADGEIILESWKVSFPKAALYETVIRLSQKLCSLQPVVSNLETHIEVQRATIDDLMSQHRGNTLMEQEKHRNLEKQREELVNFQRLQEQCRQEQMQWEQAQEKLRVQTEIREKELREREMKCSKQKEQLAKERHQLERCREEYQQDLERLRGSMRAVEKEKEKLEQLQKKLKKNENGLNTGNLSLKNEEIQITPPYPTLNVSSFEERPPLVPPHGKSISALPVKTDVPLHLFSTTNQSHKVIAIQQQIPTELASQPKGKEKHRKHHSHHHTNSAAGIEVSQVLPIKVAGKEGSRLRAMRSKSPQQLNPDILIHPEELSSAVPCHSNTSRKHHNNPPHTTQPGHRKTKDH